MKFGLRYASLGRFGNGPDAVEICQAAEAAGFDSVWSAEHVVIPKGYASRYPYADNGRLGGSDREDFPIPDPFIWMAYVGAATTTIKLGSAVVLLPQRNPVVTAKTVATLDNMTGGGRILLGVGVGWLKEEFDALGVPFEDRGPRTDDYIKALRVLWSDECPTYHGEFVSFDDAYCRPQPVGGHVPIHIGGSSKPAARRAGRLADGYFPARGNPIEYIDLARRTAEEHGRDPDAIEITGAPPEDLSEIAELEAAGVHRIGMPLFQLSGFHNVLNTPEDIERFGREVIDTYGS